MTPDTIPGFGEPVLFGTELQLPVYTTLEGRRPVLVLHELPGMTPQFLDYCRRLVADGYRVTAPLLFYRPGGRMTNAQMARLCLSREFRRMFWATRGAKGSRRFTRWLLELTRSVVEANPEKKVGVIGMCLTGGFALATIAEDRVQAAVACQPAYPFLLGIERLGLSSGERDGIRRRAGTLPAPCAKGYRFEDDSSCRDSHMRAAEGLFPDGAFERFEDLPGSGHSTVTADEPVEAVYRDIQEFLDTRL